MSKVLRAKYYPTAGIMNASAKSQSSWLWKSWMSAKEVLQRGMCYQVGNGKSIRIWESPWLPHTVNFRPLVQASTKCNLRWVSKLIKSDDRSWNEELVQQTFCERDVEAILEMSLSQTDGMDKLIWKFSKSGEFTVHPAYKRVEQ